MVLEEFFGHLLGKKRWGDGVMRDLELSLHAQGAVHPAYDTMLDRCRFFAYFGRLLGCAFAACSGGLLAKSYLPRHRAPYLPSQSIMQILLAVPPRPVILMLGCCCACMPAKVKMEYYDLQHGFAKTVLNSGEEEKMELAKIILNKHSDDRSLVEAVKRHFIADNVFSDQHQEKPPLLRWRERGSYMDGASLEKLKEYQAAVQKMMKELEPKLKKMINKYYEANSSDDGTNSVVMQLEYLLKKMMKKNIEEQLACMLGAPGDNMEINKPPE